MKEITKKSGAWFNGTKKVTVAAISAFVPSIDYQKLNKVLKGMPDGSIVKIGDIPLMIKTSKRGEDRKIVKKTAVQKPKVQAPPKPPKKEAVTKIEEAREKKEKTDSGFKVEGVVLYNGIPCVERGGKLVSALSLEYPKEMVYDGDKLVAIIHRGLGIGDEMDWIQTFNTKNNKDNQ